MAMAETTTGTRPAALKPTSLKTATAVEMIGVNKWYGEFHVLRDINLKVERGEKPKLFGAYDGFGPGEQSRDFVHVGDVADVNLWLWKRGTSGIFNCGTGRAQPFRAVAETVIGALGKELYDRLAKAVGDLRVVGSGLNTAVKNYNTFVSSFETRALVSARKLRDLNIEPGAREIETIAPVELLAGHAGEDELDRLAAE